MQTDNTSYESVNFARDARPISELMFILSLRLVPSPCLTQTRFHLSKLVIHKRLSKVRRVWCYVWHLHERWTKMAASVCFVSAVFNCMVGRVKFCTDAVVCFLFLFGAALPGDVNLAPGWKEELKRQETLSLFTYTNTSTSIRFMTCCAKLNWLWMMKVLKSLIDCVFHQIQSNKSNLGLLLSYSFMHLGSEQKKLR